MKARTEATKFQVSNVKRWIKSANEKPIEKEELEFLEKKGDLIPVVPKARTPLRRFIDKFDILRLPSCLRDREVSDLPGLVLYSCNASWLTFDREMNICTTIKTLK